MAMLSKLLDRAEDTRVRLGIPRHYVAGSLLATALAVYAARVAYPVVRDSLLASAPENNNNKLKKPAERTKPSQPRPRADNDETAKGETVPPATASKSGKALALRRTIELNLVFVKQFLRLVRIMVPSVFCGETFILLGHTLVLCARTFLTIYVANMEGEMVKYIVRKDGRNFMRMLVKWFAVAMPATFVNSAIRFLESRLALAFRTRLVNHSYELYFKNQSYYRCTVLDGRLDNCAQRLTDDIETVSTVVSRLYGQITKPLFDLLLITVAVAGLTRSAKASIIPGPALSTIVILATAYVLRLVSPKFGQLVAQEAEKKGHLRHVHARLIANAEEIAFYNGHKVELSHLRSAYGCLVAHMEKVLGIKLWFIMLEQFLMKYVWGGAGMVAVSLPIFISRGGLKSEYGDGGISERTQYFMTAKNLLVSGSDAVERLMSSYKDIVELAGHTARVENMFAILEETSRGVYKKTIVAKKESGDEDAGRPLLEYKDGMPLIKGKVIYSNSGVIRLVDVPIVTPNCDVVCSSLSLSLEPGMHLLITGPNGCGKSSLLRILSGLWPIYKGELTMPKNSLFYIPQRPYMVIGSLRDQVIYPDTYADMRNKQCSEDDLRDIMKMVHLDHIVERDSFQAVKDWTDILSGGEKQRMAIARLFYHKPKYALLDECTSAVSIDVESNMYQRAIDMGITLMTITHRPTLWKFHTHILQFDGTGNWEFGELNNDQRMDLKEEKRRLLAQMPSEERNRRLAEVSRLLGEDVDQ